MVSIERDSPFKSLIVTLVSGIHEEEVEEDVNENVKEDEKDVIACTSPITQNRGRRTLSKQISTERWTQIQLEVYQNISISMFYTPWQFYVQIVTPE